MSGKYLPFRNGWLRVGDAVCLLEAGMSQAAVSQDRQCSKAAQIEVNMVG
jgi:hypothetical protein